MDKPLWSTVIIARNESKTLPKLMASLKDFQGRGGEVVLLDTGSTDGTPDIARSFGCLVTEVGDIYRHEISEDLARQINEHFIVDDDEPVVKAGEHYFDFNSARNHVASLASNDMVSFADADEAFTRMDIDAINKLISDGVEQFEYNFVFAHDAWGNESVKFVQSKFHDRRKLKWTNLVHEVLTGSGRRQFIGENIFKLEHWQNHETNRHSYLIGLAVDCFQRPQDDRNSHYFARELFWTGRNKSAMKEFERHISMNRWHAEKAESMIYVGDILGRLNRPDEQVEWYQKAFNIDGGRRKALLRLAGYYKHMNDHKRCGAYASAALFIPQDGYYANDMAEYRHIPHEFIYWAAGWIGDIKKAQEHITLALRYEPYNGRYLEDTKYYFDYKYPGIDGWMKWDELMFLHDLAKKFDTICEVGSWKGRSTHALLAAKRAHITCVDSWQGAIDNRDLTSSLAKQEDILAIFKENTKEFDNKTLVIGNSWDMGKQFPDKHFEAIFIDAGHDYDSISRDLKEWLPKASKFFCGHDYMVSWMGVIQAVDEVFGKPDGVCDTIWYVDLTKRDPNDPKKHI